MEQKGLMLCLKIAEILSAGHAHSEEIILNSVSLGGSPTNNFALCNTHSVYVIVSFCDLISHCRWSRKTATTRKISMMGLSPPGLAILCFQKVILSQSPPSWQSFSQLTLVRIFHWVPTSLHRESCIWCNSLYEQMRRETVYLLIVNTWIIKLMPYV